MFKVDPVKELRQENLKQDAEIAASQSIKQVLQITNGDSIKENMISGALGERHTISRAQERNAAYMAHKKLEQEYQGEIYTFSQIRNLALKYKLRFLSTRQFSQTIPVDVIQEIRRLDDKGLFGRPLDKDDMKTRFYIMAPEKMFYIPDEDVAIEKIVMVDPIMFFKIDENTYRMVKVWGNSFTKWRQILAMRDKTKWSYMISRTIERFPIAVILCMFLIGSANMALHPFAWMAMCFGISALFTFLTTWLYTSEANSRNKEQRYSVNNWNQGSNKKHFHVTKYVNRFAS